MDMLNAVKAAMTFVTRSPEDSWRREYEESIQDVVLIDSATGEYVRSSVQFGWTRFLAEKEKQQAEDFIDNQW